MDEFATYREMQANGGTSAAIYRVAREDGLDEIAAIRMLRLVFGLSLVEAKEAISLAEGDGATLNERQRSLIDPINKLFEQNNGSS